MKKSLNPLGVTRSIIRKGHPEDNAFVERSHQTDDQEFYIPYLLIIKNEKDLIKRGIWWQKIYNLERPHQGLGNLTPYEKLRSLGYVTGEEICLFPCLILDSICCLDPFKIKTKSVQDHLDHDHLLSRKGQSFVRFRYFGILIPNLSINSLISFNQNISLGEG